MTFTRRARALPYIATTLFAATFVGLVQLAVPATALARIGVSPAAAASAVAGYVSVGSGTTSDYASYDSADTKSGAVTVSPVGTGVYQVTFAKLAAIANSAVVQVSDLGSGGNCTAAGWVPVGTALRATVTCFESNEPDNKDFSLVVTHVTGQPHGTFDYALNTRANTSGNLTGFAFNSAHKKNSVKFLGTGKYQVTFGGPKTSGTQGIVKVTPFGAQPGECQPVSWTGSAKGELVNVRCYDAAHALADRTFIVTYATASSLMGINGQVVANAFANSRAPVYQPTDQFDSGKGARVTVAHYAKGFYEVLEAGSSGNVANFLGNVQVNAVGSRDQRCQIVSQGNELTPSLIVACLDAHDKLVDSPFTIEWVVP